jgi:alcohol dehydrogenase YqhD (iron-dependent ADH family)
MRYFLSTKTRKLAQIGREVFGIAEKDDLAAAKACIDSFVGWFRKIGTPTTLAEAKIPADAVDKMAPDALKTAQAWGLGELYTLEKCAQMFRLCL